MAADDFYLGGGNSGFPRKERAKLGIRLASLWRRGHPDLQRAVRQLAHDFGFRTLRDYLYPEHRRAPLGETLFEELMHGTAPGAIAPWWDYIEGIEDSIRDVSRRRRSGLGLRPSTRVQ